MAKGKGTRPRVYARLRPMFGRDAGQDPLFNVEGGCSLEYKKEDAADVSRFTFDKVFGMESSQEEVFAEIGEVALDSLRKGFNSTILAYGQTGSGKTFSMEGAKDSATGQYTSRGLIPRIFESVFALFSGDPLIKEFTVSLQFIELYNEQLQDLLGNRKVVEVSGDPTGGYQCREAVRHVCKDPADAQAVYNKGCSMRATASTKMNEASSRSHALLQLSVAWVEQRGKSFAQLNLVDLAGSEGMKKTGAEGKNAKEGIKINLSLTKLALTVKCLAEGSKHIPYRESKLTMMLAKGLGGNNMLHIILALSNSRLQVAEGTACLRFGQSCLSMTVNPNANKLEKEQAEMKAVIKEQMQEISALQQENEDLKAQLEENKKRGSSAADGEIPEYMIAKHIEVNKEALQDDLKEAAEQIEDLKAALEEKRREKLALTSSGADGGADGGSEADAALFVDPDAPEFAGLEPQAKAEAIEAKRRELMVGRMKAVAENEQEQKAYEGELAQLLEIQTKLEARLAGADAEKALEQERIRAEIEERAAEERRAVEEKAAEMEAALRTAEAERVRVEEERLAREKELQEEIARKEETMRKEEQLREQISKASAEENAELQERMARLVRERQEQDAEIERARQEASRVDALQKEAQAAIEAKQQQEEELAKMRAQIEQMARDSEARAQANSSSEAMKQQLTSDGGSVYEPAEVMISRTEVRLARKARRAKTDPEAVSQILATLPVLSACNDLRALTDLEPANRTMFQGLGGVHRLVDYLRPKGQNAPYATIVARTLPCVMDKEGRRQFHEYASGTDADGEVRFRYLLALLQSSDPDDKENACLAIAAAAQESEANRQAFFEFGIAAQVYGVLQEQSQLPIPRQRLQRVVVMAMGELANNFDPYKELLRGAEGVPMLLSFLTPSHDEYLIKETLQLLGRMTQTNAGIQSELQRHNAIDRYSNLLFAQMHDTQIAELAALALVNLISEVPQCLQRIETHPRYNVIRFELLASMARALTASMLRADSTEMSLAGGADFHFWGSAVVGSWSDGCAGGDRKHSSFVENPQYLIRAPAGTNLCVVLMDTEEATREQARVKTRPLFLRLCVTAATPETLATRLKQLDLNSAGARPASVHDESGVVQLEPNVQAALDVSKTREVAMRCHVKSGAPEDAWVVVPHVGCSHQHSRFVLAVFADKEVKIEQSLSPWHRRIMTSSWTPLCSAPRGIADGLWRNCPQFQLINVGSAPTTVSAFLSYAERDIARNRRHTTVSDPPGGMGAEERPLLSLYVMKSKVPDKRFVGTLSPYVEEYVAHSVITNSWCVSTRWVLEPGDVYAILAVMAEGTTHEVPLRLTLFTQPEASGEVLLKPLSAAAEWHVSVLEGRTDESGCTQLELLPQGNADGGGAGSSTQAALVMETGEPTAFCSIATDHEGVPHKMLTKYQQQQAVLSVPFTTGSYYTMTTRCINSSQENLKQVNVRMYLYSTRPMQASPLRDNLYVDHKATRHLVCRSTAADVVYGEEGEPEDLRRQESAGSQAEELQRDPKVLQAVIGELESQRDSLFEFNREALKGGGEAAVLERMRSDNQQLMADKAAIEAQLREARALAAASGASAAAAAKGGGGGDPAAMLAQAEAAKRDLEVHRQARAEAEQQLSQHRRQVESLTSQLQAALAGDVGAATAALQKELTEAQRDLYAEQMKVMRLEQAASAAAASGAGGAPQARQVQAELEQVQAENKRLKQQVMETPKSSACTLL